MSSYATPTDLRRYVTAAAIQGILDPELQAALDEASDEADGYLRAQEILPLVAPYPLALTRHVCAIAVWNVMSKRGFNPQLEANALFEKNYDMALKWLTSVARGQVSLAVGADSSPTPRPGGARISSDRLRGW